MNDTIDADNAPLAVRDESKMRYAIAPPSFAMPRSIADIQVLGQMMIESGFFKDVRSVSQACVKIIAGAALGYDPFTSMNAFHIIEGKVAPTAGEIAARIKRSGKYDFRVERLDNEYCALVFLEKDDGAWNAIGRSEFAKADAVAAGLAGKDVWRKYGRNMYFSRALTNGARWFCPDVFGGPVYTPEELGADVTIAADGEMRVVTDSRPDTARGGSSHRGDDQGDPGGADVIPPRVKPAAAGSPEPPLPTLVELHAQAGSPNRTLGAWAVEHIDPGFAQRKPRVFTASEEERVRELLDAIIKAPVAPVAPEPAGAAFDAARSREGQSTTGSERMSPRQQGMLFALLDERVGKDKASRHAFAAECGIALPVRDGEATFSGLSAAAARKLIERLEMIPPHPDEDEALEVYAEQKLL